MGSGAFLLHCIWTMSLFLSVFSTNCSVNVEGCLKCDSAGVCMKCRQLMEERTRTCVSACGAGQKEAWSTGRDLMGRLCVEAGLWVGLGLSGQGAAVVVGCLVGVALSVALLIGGAFYMRQRANAQLLTQDDCSDSTLTVTPLNSHDRGEFLAWLAGLRPEATTFLAMLNETRAQARSASSVQPYKPVLRDLLTLLLLLNTPEARIIAPPPDWRRLLGWAERVLRRYKRHSQISPASPVGELVSFLPCTNTMSTTCTNSLQSRKNDWTTDTFSEKSWKSGYNNNSTTSSGKMRRASVLDTEIGRRNYRPTVSPQKLNRFSFSDAQLAAQWDQVPSSQLSPQWDQVPNVLPLWSVPSREILHENEYGPLGFRPQDEITTEL